MNKLKKIKQFLNNELILIYQMGKVASTSIENSLKEKNKTVIHTHSFFTVVTYEMFKKFYSVKYHVSFLDRIFYRLKWAPKLWMIKRNYKIKIISLTREPISRNVSMFFQDIHIPAFEFPKLGDNRFESNVNLQSLQQLFYEKLNHHYGVEWFDKELKKSFGIDVYQYPFDKEKGFSVIKEGNIQLMIIKMEKLNDLEEEIGGFLEIEDFKLVNENTSENKWYSSVYREFKKIFKPTNEYMDRLYNTDYMKHFYSEEEIETFKQKWLK